jgi:tight adherence protein B
MDYIYYLFVVLGFIAIFLLLEGLYSAWNTYKGPEVLRIEKRLRALSAGSSTTASKLIKQRLLSNSETMQSLLLSIPRVHALDRMLLQSGTQINVATFLWYTLLSAAIAALVAVLLKFPFTVAGIAALIATLLPWRYIVHLSKKRKATIEQQLPDTLDLMSRAMLAGHAFPSALKMVGDEMPEPISGEFRIVFDEINYGISVPDALNNLVVRVPSTDMSYLVISVLLQRETGGNLAALLDSLSKLIRERMKLLGTIKVLSAEGKLSAQILTVLPFVLALAIHLLNPEFLSVLWTDSLGIKLVSITILMIIGGIYWMRRIIKIRI